MAIRDTLASNRKQVKTAEKAMPKVIPPKPGGDKTTAKKAPEYARFVDVPARCGHPVRFGLLDDKKDKYREQRKLKVTDRDCAECRGRA
jgi:hypothetical protein